ncbi:hypothetical protein ABCA12_3088 [Acinetobacter junii]|uniref:hypothetical protein n=1 Tax=Acinetobacter junii TaxID=40215 RepID=UPI001AF58ADC|nr:hypothetical protein [Acinetobacter junii]QQV67623.1 hypothetical protein ABCA12_3088 [Acinetobacter junii]
MGREEGFVSQVSHHDTQRVPVDSFILPSQLCDPHNRDAIANALQEDDAQIPEQFKPCYYNYQNVHHRFYLKQINLLGQLCFLFYFFADWFLLPDISFISGLSRVVAVLGFVILNMLMFKYCKILSFLIYYSLFLVRVVRPFGFGCSVNPIVRTSININMLP